MYSGVMIMRLISDDGKRTVNVGGGDIWKALYSTTVNCLGKKKKSTIWHLIFFSPENVKARTDMRSQGRST